jgi:hypothetical protein
MQRLTSESTPPPLRSTQDRRTDQAPAPVQPEPEVIEEVDNLDARAAEPVEAEPEGEQLEAEAQTEAESEGDENADDPRYSELTAEIERLQSRERELTADYTRKTQKIAEARRAIERQFGEIEAVATFYSNLSKQPISQFQNLDWNALKAQPEQYQQANRAYQQAMAQAEQLENARQQVLKLRGEQLDRVKTEEAQVSKEILKARIPGWNNERYAKVRDFVINELNFTQAEVDDWTDWRLMAMAHTMWQVSQAPAVTKKVNRDMRQERPQQGRNVQKVNRNADGRYQNARDAAFSRPGDKQTFREMKAAQLRREREARNRF